MQQTQASEEQDISFQAQIPCNTYQETFTQHWNEIWLFLQEELAVSHGQYNGTVFNSYLIKVMTEIANPHQMPSTSGSHVVVAN